MCARMSAGQWCSMGGSLENRSLAPCYMIFIAHPTGRRVKHLFRRAKCLHPRNRIGAVAAQSYSHLFRNAPVV